jgi:hypothetical protein
MVRVDRGLWFESLLSSWKGKCGGRHSKPQELMQPSHNPTSHILLWSRRAKSLSDSTQKIEQHSPHFNYQGRCHRCSKNICWNGSYPKKIRVGWSAVFLIRCRLSLMIQGSSCGSERFRASPQDHGWGSLLSIFYPSRSKQDVSWLKEELLVDENEARDSEVCDWMWHMLKSQEWSFETSWKPIYVWILLWVYHEPRMGITPYGSFWTAQLSHPTLYPYPPHTGSDNMLSCTCHTLSAIMASWRPLSLTEGLSLLYVFWSNCITVWAPISSEAPSIILRLVGKLSEWIESSNICFMLVFWMMVQNGTITFHKLSSHITTTIKKVSICHLLKHSMDDHTIPHWVGLSPAKGLSLGPTL